MIVVKFVVLLARKPGSTREWFRSYLRHVHGPLAEAMPGLAGYVQNHVTGDPARRDPDWDAVLELWWDTSEAMERAWGSPEGKAATADLVFFADLAQTRWAVVEEEVRQLAPTWQAASLAGTVAEPRSDAR